MKLEGSISTCVFSSLMRQISHPLLYLDHGMTLLVHVIPLAIIARIIAITARRPALGLHIN